MVFCSFVKRKDVFMKVYVSHLIYDDEIKALLDIYQGIGIESIEFSMSSSLDTLKESIQKYRERMGNYIVEHPFSVHGPFLDLQPMSWDTLAAQVAWKRYEQAYEAAATLNADRIVYHTYVKSGTAGNTGLSAV
jgi:sugar phosphate isomerase/epimerase